MKATIAEQRFQIFNYIFLTLLAFIMLYPVWHVLMYSISEADKTIGVSVFLYPRGFSVQAYRIVLKNPLILSAYKNTIFVVTTATALNILMTFLMAYPLSKRDLRGRTFFTFFIFLTMIFGGGLIPTFLVVRAVGLLNSLWSLILPSAVNAFFIFILRNFIQTIPESLSESAKIDGAHEFIILFKIIIPLSLPAIAVFAVMYGVGHWNSWFAAIIYLNDVKKFTLQPILRQIVFVMNTLEFFEHDPDLQIGAGNMPQVVINATIMIATLPIVMIYPFLQKYFIKGIMIGAIKG